MKKKLKKDGYMKCMACGEIIKVLQKHTYNDCLRYKERIKE